MAFKIHFAWFSYVTTSRDTLKEFDIRIKVAEKIPHQFARNAKGQIHSILHFVVNVVFLYSNTKA